MADRVLYLIDDDESVRDATALLLEVAGFQVSSFASAEDFLLAVDEPEGAILADVRLPGISGLQLLRELNARQRAVAVILMSAHCDDAMRHEVLDACAEDLLLKPVNPGDLIECVKRCFDAGI
jgi:FixJ family two-component response regulator